MEQERKSLFEALDSKTALLLGLAGGFLILCTIGFFVLGALVLKHGVGSPLAGAPVAAAVPPAAAPAGNDGPQAVPAATVGVGHFPARGNKNAKVRVVEFADFRCPFCERFYTQSAKSIMTDYVNTGKVVYYFRSFAFLGPASTDASLAAECANEQGQFWKFHDWLYDHQADESNTAYYSKDNLIKYASDLGLNKAKFTSCLNSGKYSAQVNQDLSDGQALGVNGTPTTFVNGKPLVGAQPYSAVKAAIDAALAS